ncbi:hypothetical protein [Kitasatospora arboriphila]|uniref:Uncharacterized protein n=1 Tax=Kitasatospora arboriphila TaxID=258052 RepID=A0ABP4DX91_9ACTN
MPDSDPQDSLAARRRERGLRRVGAVTAALLTTAAAGTAGAGAEYRALLPGATAAPATSPDSGTPGTTGTTNPRSALQPPSRAPAPVAPHSRAPSATTGAS